MRRKNETAYLIVAIVWLLGLLWLVYVAEYVDP